LSQPPRTPQPPEKIARGEAVYAQFCSTCHGQNAIGSGPKDLRYISPQSHTDFIEIVLGGKFRDKGMVPFTGTLTEEQVDAVHSYVISRGQEDSAPVFGGGPPPPPPTQR
jgi:quinohemoprotein ethanol dehydrogenase